jgi:tetratricopeptide (TPR) repeat protein
MDEYQPNRRLALFARSLWLALCVAVSVSASLNTHAARQQDKTQSSGAIDARTFDVLMNAQKQTESGHFNAALKTLEPLKSSSKLNSYARSQMWNFYAYIYATQEKYDSAITSYKNVLAEVDAPAGLKMTAKYTMAQLYFQMEDYPSVIKLMEQWLGDIEEPTATAHIMLTQAYYQNRSYDKSLQNLLTAIELVHRDGNKIKENWLRLKAAIYFEKNDRKKTLETYEELMSIYPRESYLRQIAGLHGESGNERKRLAFYDALHVHGSLTKETELLNLAYMYLGQEIPHKAGRIIARAMKDGEIESGAKNVETLANAWAQANEHRKAIPALQNAAQMSDKGLLYARLAGVYFDAGDFENAASAARKANTKGELKRKDNNQMLLGMALFNLHDFEAALQAFRQAKQSRKIFADARKWEDYTLSEIERLSAIEQSKFQLAKETERTLKAQENNVNAIGGSMLRLNRADSIER